MEGIVTVLIQNAFMHFTTFYTNDYVPKTFYKIIPKQYHGFSKARVTSPGCGLVEFSDYVAAQYAITQLNQKSQFLGQ